MRAVPGGLEDNKVGDGEEDEVDDGADSESCEGAHALDDESGYDLAGQDSGAQHLGPDSETFASLVDEEKVGDRGGHERFERSGGHALDDSHGRQGRERCGEIAPDTRDEKDHRRDQKEWSLSPDVCPGRGEKCCDPDEELK